METNTNQSMNNLTLTPMELLTIRKQIEQDQKSKCKGNRISIYS